ncbi:hypothetical protein BC829DRAFT_401169 [Chytridium lagenaria]|nr:hypothetical protein BC829DRAFT_401169 [Chytridium lagenaria]
MSDPSLLSALALHFLSFLFPIFYILLQRLFQLKCQLTSAGFVPGPGAGYLPPEGPLFNGASACMGGDTAPLELESKGC